MFDARKSTNHVEVLNLTELGEPIRKIEDGKLPTMIA